MCSETVNLNVFSSVTTPPLTFFFQPHIFKNTQKLEISIKSNPQKKIRTGFPADVIFASKPLWNTGIYIVLWWKGVQNLGFTAKITSPMHGRQSGFSGIRVNKGYISEIIPISHMQTWHQRLTCMVLPLVATTCLLATGYRFKTSSYTCNKIDLPKVHLSLHGFHWFHGLHLLHGLHRFHALQGLHVLHCLLLSLAFVAFIGLRWPVAFGILYWFKCWVSPHETKLLRHLQKRSTTNRWRRGRISLRTPRRRYVQQWKCSSHECPSSIGPWKGDCKGKTWSDHRNETCPS